MSKSRYYLHQDGKSRFLLQNVITGIIEGLVFPGMPGESAHAFSYNYGSVWFPDQLHNLKDFPELADMPFFTIESCGFSYLDSHFKQAEPQPIWSLLGAIAKLNYYSCDLRLTAQQETAQIIWRYAILNPKGMWKIPILDLWINEQGCWFCTREGQVLVLNHQGEMIQHYDLPKLTSCLAGLDDVPYVSCDDGNLYDLTSKLPQAIYAVRPLHDDRYTYQIIALCHPPEWLLIADVYGYLQALNLDWELQWQQYHPDDWLGWVLHSDTAQLYHGHYQALVT